jgi:cysteinyl-tRNA synthetase
MRAENPDWKGNFKVAYWDPAWQEIILHEAEMRIKQGFDGLMLDIVDAFEFFENQDGTIVDGRVNPATGESFRADMVTFVKRIAQRVSHIDTDAWVIPQNGIQLLAEPGYRSFIAMQALEDLYTLGDARQSSEHTEYVLQFARAFPDLVLLSTEYPEEDEYQHYARTQAARYGTALLLTDRALTRF